MAKYAVTFKYLNEPSKVWSPVSGLGRKNFQTKKEAENFAKAQAKAGKIQPLKLIDCSDINCPTTVKEYNLKAKKPSGPKTTTKKAPAKKATVKKAPARKVAPKKATSKRKK